MKIRPLGDRLLVKRVEEQTKTAGGILIPDNAKEKPAEGSVMAVGPGKVQANGRLREMEVKVGDTVLFGKYGGTEVKLDGVDYVILREEDVLGIIKG
jgi:chaperonin GroES